MTSTRRDCLKIGFFALSNLQIHAAFERLREVEPHSSACKAEVRRRSSDRNVSVYTSTDFHSLPRVFSIRIVESPGIHLYIRWL